MAFVIEKSLKSLSAWQANRRMPISSMQTSSSKILSSFDLPDFLLLANETV